MSQVGSAGYAYNAQRQRSRKISGSQGTVYHYDLAGNLIAETDTDGNLRRDYVWADGTPVAQIEAGEKIAYLHTDHLSTPRLATNTQGQVVWRWEGTAFGETYPNEDVDGDGKVTTVNLRFPGQYHDAESGLHYNWHRYYDPKVGRYVTSDPVGLEGGLNTFIYVRNNSLKFADPTGLLDNWEPGGGIGGNSINGGWRYNNWYGNWCGPGGSGRTISGLDCACKKHDKCYEACGLDAGSRWKWPEIGTYCPLQCDIGLIIRSSRSGPNNCGCE